MKQTKLLKPFWLAAMLLLLNSLSIMTFASDLVVDGLCYDLRGNEAYVTFQREYAEDAEDSNDYEIVPYNLTGELTIPSSINVGNVTYNVVAIDKYTFMSCTGITKVSIPASVKSIGDYAFYGCSNLETIHIGDNWTCNITSIGNNVFDGTKWYNDQPNGLTYLLGDKIAYKYKGSLAEKDKNLDLGFVKVVAAGCFSGKPIKNVNFSVVEYIGKEAFYNTSLKLANLQSVKTVEEQAFLSCYSLEEVVLGKNISRVEGRAFESTPNLKNVYIRATTKPTFGHWSDEDQNLGAFYSFGDGRITLYVPSELINAYTNDWDINNDDYVYNRPITFEELVEVSYISQIQSDKTEILVGEQVPLTAVCRPDNASTNTCSWSSNHSYVASVDENGVVTGLTKGTATITAISVCGNASAQITFTVSFPTVTVGDYTYEIDEANGIAGVKANNTNIASLSFDNTVEYNGVIYPVKKIAANGFSNCVNIDELIIPNNITTVENSAFSHCRLTKVVIPASVTSIGHFAFFDCSSLNEVVFEDGDEEILLGNSKYSDGIGGGLFEYCPIETVYIGRNIRVSNYNDSYNRPYSNAPFSCWYANSYTPIKTATISANVTKLCDYFFERCNAIETLTSYVSDPTQILLGNYVFRDVPKSTCILQVPAGSMAAYQAASQWKDFTNIVEMAPPTVLATSVALDQTQAELTVGETLQLAATVLPEDATDKTLTWTSSDETVATVENGLVTAVAAGTASITATTADGSNLSASCALTVNPLVILATSVALDQTQAELTVGETLQLAATVLPEDATDKTLTWTSSDETVATVENGLVTAIAAGTATITATTAGGSNLSASCALTVNPLIILATSVTLDQTEAELTVGETLQLAATVLPEDATDKTLTWTSSDETVATVENGLVTAVAAGTVTITATTADGSNLSASCALTVNPLIVPGDANGDNSVNATDYVATANYILGDIPEGFDISAADLDGNGVIDVVDLVAVTNMILAASAPSPAPSMLRTAGLAIDDGSCLYVEHLNVTPGSMTPIAIALDNQQPYSALQADVYLPQGLTIVSDFVLTDRKGKDHSVACQTQPDGAVRIFVKSPSSKNIKDVSGALVTFTVVADGSYREGSIIELRNIIASTAQAVGYSLPDYVAGSVVTGINDLQHDGNGVDNNYYNLLGIPIKNPTPGIYIKNGKKVIVK